MGQSRMDNPEKPATLGTQNTRRRTKQIERKKKHNRICVGQHYRKTNRNNVNKIKVLRTTFWSACKLESD
jgi:hypothetical protein